MWPYTSLIDGTLLFMMEPFLIFLTRFFVQSWMRCNKPAMTRTGVPRARAHGLKLMVSTLQYSSYL